MKLVCVEGCDGAGKTSFIRRMIYNLVEEDVGLVVRLASFPRYHTPIGSLIQSYLHEEWDTDPETFEMIMGADKSDFEQQLQEWEHDTDIVLIDRYWWTQEAYASANGVRSELIEALGANLRHPDLTILLDIDPETTMKRKEVMGYSDRYESNYELMKAVRLDYIFKYMQDDDAVRIDATQPMEDVHREGWDVIRESVALPLLQAEGGST